jgi:hypothetical protein
MAATAFHVTLTTDNVAEAAADPGTLAGEIWTIYGIVMKIVMRFGKTSDRA